MGYSFIDAIWSCTVLIGDGGGPTSSMREVGRDRTAQAQHTHHLHYCNIARRIEIDSQWGGVSASGW